MKAIKLLLVAVVLTVFVISPLVAEECCGGHKGAGWNNDCNMMGLDSEHAAKLNKLRIKDKQEVIDLEAKVKKIHLKMKAEFLDDDPDMKTLEALAEELALAKSELHKNKIRFLFKVKKVLPEKEWQLFMRNHAKMGSGMGDCHNRGTGMCGGRGSMKKSSRGSYNGRCVGEAGMGCKPRPNSNYRKK